MKDEVRGRKDVLVLSGDDIQAAMPTTDAEVNHLRRLLAWIRLEHGLDEDMMRGYIEGATIAVRHDPSCQDRAQQLVQERADKIASVPLYVRQAVKMLTKAVRDHDTKTRMIYGSAP